MPPPFSLTPKLLGCVATIERLLGRLEGLSLSQPQPQLRKRNRVRTVQASAAIEGNRLSEAQVTALLDGKRVLGRAQDVREILNVNAAYERLPRWKPSSVKSLLAAHGVLMKGLVARPGHFRTSGVGVFRGRRLAHLAPPAHLVPGHVADLLAWLDEAEVHPLIAGCVIHYELLFIHPFMDGNGRLARLWQQVIHRQSSALLQFVPVESVIRDRQRQYYDALRASDRGGDCTAFVEFALAALSAALGQLVEEVRPARETIAQRLERARARFGRRWFSRADYRALHVKLSTASASRDLAGGREEGLLEARGERRFTEYRFRARP